MPSVTASATNDSVGIHRSPMAELARRPAAPFIVVLKVILALPGISDSSDFQHALMKVHHRMLLATVAKKIGNACVRLCMKLSTADCPRT